MHAIAEQLGRQLVEHEESLLYGGLVSFPRISLPLSRGGESTPIQTRLDVIDQILGTGPPE